MVPTASGDVAEGETPGVQPKGGPGWDPPPAENALQLPRAGTHGHPAGLLAAECRMIYGSLQMACSSQRVSDQQNESLLLP